jgi:hypothetical protein
MNIDKIGKIGEYENGNYKTVIFEDGTRIRATEDNEFISTFPDSIDLNISHKCKNACHFCYANNTGDGKQADLTQPYLYTMHPFTEIAINLNTDFDKQKGFHEFLEKQRDNHVIVNGTIFIKDLYEKRFLIYKLQEKKLLNGIGISIGSEWLSEKEINLIKAIPNAVVHVVDKIVDCATLASLLQEPELRILVLGFKKLGRAKDINPLRLGGVPLGPYIQRMHNTFDIVSYDNLALESLKPQQYISDEEFEICYQGDDGMHTFYIDAVNNTYAVSSNNEETYPIKENQTIRDIFQELQK